MDFNGNNVLKRQSVNTHIALQEDIILTLSQAVFDLIT